MTNIKRQLRAFQANAALRLKCLWMLLKCARHPRRFASNFKHQAEHPPVFIVGCGHSGTSLLLAMLGAHSRLCAIPGETRLAYDYRTNRAVLNAEALMMILSFDLLTVAEYKKRWVEKTPKHIHSIPLLRGLFAGAKFIIILRDGRDVACSIRARYGSLEDAIGRWIEDNRAGEVFWKDPDVHVVRYEDIVEDAEKALREVIQFVGENFEEQMLRTDEKPKYYYAKKIEKPPDESAAYHDQYRNWQINQKLFDGRGKWKQLSLEDKDIIKKAAGEMLIQYGYATDLDW